MEAFQSFTPTHAFALLGIAGACWLLAAIGRRQADPAWPTTLEKSLAAANLLLWLTAHGWWLMRPQLDLKTTLPLQMCHLVSVVASLALLTRARAWRALLYFWGLGLCTQALLTPSLTDPPRTVWFWSFWLQHGFIMVAVVHDLAVYRYRPDWRDYRIACAAAVAYLAVVLPLDIALGANYGFVGESRPETPSIVDVLGPWPERLAVIVALVAAVMAVLMLPWQFSRWRRGVASR